MLYLFIMVAVAAAGITRLWLQQRRMNVRMNSVDGFRESLEKISPPSPYGAATQKRPGQRPARRAVVGSGRHPQPMDPARREAAKRRIEARRRARQHVA